MIILKLLILIVIQLHAYNIEFLVLIAPMDTDRTLFYSLDLYNANTFCGIYNVMMMIVLKLVLIVLGTNLFLVIIIHCTYFFSSQEYQHQMTLRAKTKDAVLENVNFTDSEPEQDILDDSRLDEDFVPDSNDSSTSDETYH